MARAPVFTSSREYTRSMATNYLTAREAAKALGVSIKTLYVYVSRKGIRSQPIPGTRQRRYWKPDIERISRRDAPAPVDLAQLRPDSKITLISDGALFYRGHSAVELAEHTSFEETAALLWGFGAEVFGSTPPRVPAHYSQFQKLFARESDVNRATALLPLFEAANPKAYDLSPLGMARCGADVLRTIAAFATGSGRPTAEPIHQFIARRVAADSVRTELIRRQLILAADHGLNSGAIAVRAIGSTGVTPWRSVIGGLTVTLSRRAQLSSWGAVNRLLTEIATAHDPQLPILQRIRDGEAIPGFDAPLYAQGDPRARALLDFYADHFARDSGYQRLRDALVAARSIQGLQPNFGLAFLFADRKVGLPYSHSLFHAGRAAGWIAHAIEQYQSGEPARVLGEYSGALPE